MPIYNISLYTGLALCIALFLRKFLCLVIVIRTREVNRETGNPVYRFQTGNRFAKRTTGCRIFVIDFDGLLRIRNCACCIKITHLFKVSLQIKLTLIENIQPRK